MVLHDVSVLVYAHRDDVREHEAYARYLEHVATGEAPFATSPLVLSGFVRVVTNPRVFPDPTPTRIAFDFCTSLLDRPNCRVVQPGPTHWGIFVRLCGEAGATGKLVLDAFHAALAIEHGCVWVSTDGDYARFPGLDWRHPLQA